MPPAPAGRRDDFAAALATPAGWVLAVAAVRPAALTGGRPPVLIPAVP